MMVWEQYIGPAVIAAVVSGAIAIIGFWVNRSTALRLHDERIKADAELAEKKFSWEQEQVIFKRKLELAETLLTEAYKFKELMQYVRNGIAFNGEGQTRPNRDNEIDSEQRLRDTYFVPMERLHNENQFLSTMFMKKYTAQSFFGTQAAEAFSHFHDARVRISGAVETLMWMATFSNEMADSEKTLRNELLGVIWSHRNKDDDIAKMIDEGVSKIEKFCRPILERKI